MLDAYTAKRMLDYHERHPMNEHHWKRFQRVLWGLSPMGVSYYRGLVEGWLVE